jgi:L-threonine kinase
MNFLVTCPVNIYSQVSVKLHSGKTSMHGTGNKTLQAVKRTLEYLKLPADDAEVLVESALPVGKGMASSSADISAACLATALAAGKNIGVDAICAIAIGIEPTDGIFYPGITMIDHVTGEIRRSLGEAPRMNIAVFDAGGEVDTIAFNRRGDLAGLNRSKEPEVLAALRMVQQGIEAGDCNMIGAGATLSALANQSILRKPSLERIIEISRSFGAAGVNAAHSGTVLGVLFDAAGDPDIEGCVRMICRECSEIVFFRTAQLVSGGLSIVRDSSE